MKNNIDNNSLATAQSNLYKALFCQIYFPELQKFLSDFSLSSVFKTENSTSLNMEFLLSAYDKSSKKASGQKEVKDKCYWQLGNIKESDLMLAIEEFYFITNTTVNGEKIYEERDDLLKKLFQNDTLEQIRLGDDLLRTIFSYFGIKLDPKNMTAGGMATSFENLSKSGLIPEKYKDFYNAVQLHAANRNWQQHKFSPRFYGMELHLYHRFVLYTYIGLVYVCRKIWTDEKDNIKKNVNELIEKNYITCDSINDFEMPEQLIHVDVSSPDSDITKCRVRIGSKKNGKTTDYGKDEQAGSNRKFEVYARKYTPFSLKVFRGEHADEFIKELNYQSWFLTYDITLPKSFNCKYEGRCADEPIGAAFLELLSTIETKDEKIKNVINKELGSIKDFWIASVTSAITDEREKLRKDLEQSLSFMSRIIGDSQRDTEKQIKSVCSEMSKKTENFYNEFEQELQTIKDKIEETNKNTSRTNDYLSWSTCVLFIIIAWLPLWINKFDAVDFLTWCSPLLWLCVVLLLSLIALFSFAYMHSADNYSGKLKQITIKQWCGISLIALPFFIVTYYLCMEDSIISKYVFSENTEERNKKVVKLLEERIKDEPTDEIAVTKLVNYYLNYTGENEKAWDIVKPLLEIPNISVKCMEALAEAHFQKGNYTEVQTIIDNNIEKMQSPTFYRLRGLLYLPEGGRDNYRKCDSLLQIAAQKGDAEAMYWLGHIRSNIMGDWKSSYSEGIKTFDFQTMDYDLISAISYFQQAVSCNYAKAAIELGNIYFDLNITDSAQLYFEKAISLSDQEIRNEAYYRLGLLHEGIDSINKYMNEVANVYEPAILHMAWKNDSNSYKYYKKLEDKGGYSGYRYIPPIVFYFIGKNNRSEALKYMQKARPQDNIDNKFIEALERICSGDSISIKIGEQCIRELAQRNDFAKILTLYWDISNKISNTQSFSVISHEIEELEEIGAKIPFAYVLAAWVLKDMGPSFIEKSDEFAMKAIHSGHPAGALILSYIPQSYYEKVSSIVDSLITNDVVDGKSMNYMEEDVDQLKKIYNTVQLALRMSHKYFYTRHTFINWGQKIDKFLTLWNHNQQSSDYVTATINSLYPNNHIQFWSDVALAVDDFDNEGWMLYQYHLNLLALKDINYGLPYRERLLETLLKTYSSDEGRGMHWLQDESKNLLFYNYISHLLSEMPDQFTKRMQNNYPHTMEKIKNAINETKEHSVLGRLSMNISINNWLLKSAGTQSLLEEFSDIPEGRSRIEMKKE